MSTIAYRPDIDGLRAVAVLSVVLFHFDSSYLPGGFLGVDIFFVISGFLITKIIITERLASNFSYTSFYVRRAKRILPPLFFVLSLASIASYFILLPSDFYKFGISLASVLVFLSNVQYAFRTGDYFSGDSSEWPLLHTWSLAVEEQYYFILPVLVLLILKTEQKRMILAFTILGIFSFITAEFMSRTEGMSSASYYLIITRMGELLIGSVLAAAQVKNRVALWQSQSLAAVSGIIILAMFIVVDAKWVFPGFVVIPLCLSVAIIMNSKDTFVNQLLSQGYLVKVGLVSYSLYLVHWPVLALARYVLNVERGKHSLDLNIQLVLVIVITAFSLFSYFLVEKPLRRLQASPTKICTLYFVLPTVFLGVLSLVIITQAGLPKRFATKSVDASLQFSHIDTNKCPSIVRLGCVAGHTTGEQRVLMFGNSHAEHYFEFISMSAKEFSYRAELYATGGCFLTRATAKCQKIRDSFEKNVLPNDIVVVAYRWDLVYKKEELMTDLGSWLKDLSMSQKKVILLAQPPILNINPSKLANCNRLNLDCDVKLEFDSSYNEYNAAIRALAKETGTSFFDPYEFLPDKFQIREGERSFYSDFDHLSVYGARWLYQNKIKFSERNIFENTN